MLIKVMNWILKILMPNYRVTFVGPDYDVPKGPSHTIEGSKNANYISKL